MKKECQKWKDKNGGSCLTTIPKKSSAKSIKETTIIKMLMQRWIGTFLTIEVVVVSLPRITCFIKATTNYTASTTTVAMQVGKWKISIGM